MNIRHLFVALICVLITNYLAAQVIRVDTSRQERGTNEVVIFSKDASHSDSPKEGHDKNVVKMGLINFASGNIPFYYERRLLPWLSVQGGIGLTTRDFVADIVNIIVDGGASSYNSYYLYSERKSQVGVYLSLQPKFYIHNDALDGFWLSPMFEFKRYNYKANMVNQAVGNSEGTPVYLANTFQPEFRNTVDFTFNLGWQWLFNPLEIEFLMGGGFRRFWEQRLDIEPGQQSPVTGYTMYTNGIRYYNGFRPEFNLSLNFGGFF